VRVSSVNALIDEIRWDEKAGLRTGCGVRSQVIDALEAQEIEETGKKKVSTVAAKASRTYRSRRSLSDWTE